MKIHCLSSKHSLLVQILVITALISGATSCIAQLPLSGAQGNWSARLKSEDIGSPAIHGSTEIEKHGLKVTAAGTDIWGTSDQFRFVYQQETGDFDVVVRVTSLTAPHLYSRAGIMAREDLSPASRHVFFLVFPDNRPRHNNTSAYEFQYRAQKSGDSMAIYPPQDTLAPLFPVSFPQAWLRLKRTGNKFASFVSSDGTTWKEYSSHSLELPKTLFLGLAVTSHTADSTATALFEDFKDLLPAR